MFMVHARYGAMSQREAVVSDIDDLSPNEKVVLKTERGTELGTVTSKPSQLGSDVQWTGAGRILRRATPEDLARHRELGGPHRKKTENVCRQMIQQQKLPMQLVYAEYLLGNEKLYFYFMSETRVDFRNLVRDLARQFQTRIELRQIGQREAARLVGDYNCCGHELCCRCFLRKLEPIPMAMARLQKQSLDPSKISGLCGKLKCCLRFEDQVYNELRKQLPERGKRVLCGETCGKVVGCDVYNQRVSVETVEGSHVNVPLAELREAPPGAYEQALQAASAAASESGRRAASSGRFPAAGRPRPNGRTTQVTTPPPPDGQPPANRRPDRNGRPERAGRPDRSPPRPPPAKPDTPGRP